MRRLLFLVLIGAGGAAVLLWLGFWQMQRLDWKQGVIADIDARIAAAPIPLPDVLDPEEDTYLPVEVRGVVEPDYLRVLVSQKEIGAGYRIISAFDMGGRRVLLDRGFMPVDQDAVSVHAGSVTVRGNLQWPQETDGFTPEPDLDANIWFARDVAAMAAALGHRSGARGGATDLLFAMARSRRCRLTPPPFRTTTCNTPSPGSRSLRSGS